MVEYITKNAAINAVENAPIELFQSEWEEIEEAINAAPAADVAPVVHGKWEVIHVKNHWDKARCSACKRVFESYEWGSNYCPVCGAKIDGDVKNA